MFPIYSYFQKNLPFIPDRVESEITPTLSETKEERLARIYAPIKAKIDLIKGAFIFGDVFLSLTLFVLATISFLHFCNYSAGWAIVALGGAWTITALSLWAIYKICPDYWGARPGNYTADKPTNHNLYETQSETP